MATETQPSWLRNARELVGLKEIVGSRHEPKVVAFFKEAGHPEIHDDEVPWCAAFVNAMLRRSGYAGTGSLAARSFLAGWGETLKVPRPGCIAVFKRGNSSWEGHVAFFLRDLGNSIEVLGGNQSNSVSVTTMPKSSLLGYRWPAITASRPPTPAVVVVAPSKPAAPVKKPPGKGEIAVGTGGAIIVGGAGAAAAKAGLSAPEVLAIITIASILVMGLVVIGYRFIKGKWPWSSTGEASLEPLPAPPPPSEGYLEQVQAQLEASSEVSPETPLPQHSALSRHLKQLEKPSPKIRKRRKSSAPSKASAASKSSRKPRSKSKSSKSKPRKTK